MSLLHDSGGEEPLSTGVVPLRSLVESSDPTSMRQTALSRATEANRTHHGAVLTPPPLVTPFSVTAKGVVTACSFGRRRDRSGGHPLHGRLIAGIPRLGCEPP